MKWFVVRDPDHYVYWFDHDIIAKAFASLQARQHPQHKYIVGCSVQNVWMGEHGVVTSMVPGVVRDGTGGYNVYQPPPMKPEQNMKLIQARRENDPKKFIDLMSPDLMKPGSVASEALEAEAKDLSNVVSIEKPPLVDDPEIDAIGDVA